MGVPTILFNASTGSDSLASGAGPATALTGTNASFSGSVVTLDGSPDLSGVATDGTHVLWLLTSTGAQFFAINAKDDGADTVTVDVAPGGTSTGRTWAIGGKRATFDEANSRNLFTASLLDGWTIVTETDNPFSAGITLKAEGDTTVGPVTIKGDSASAIRLISMSANASITVPTGASYRFENLKFQNTNGTKTSANGLTIGVSSIHVKNCVIGDVTNTLNIGITTGSNATAHLEDTRIVSCASHGIVWAGTGMLRALNTAIASCGGAGITSAGTGAHTIERSIIHGCTSDGFLRSGIGSAVAPTIVAGCTIHGNGGDGIDLTAAGSSSYFAQIYNNNITGNGGYGINAHAQTDAFKAMIDYNNFGTGATANTSGARNNVSAGANDLAVDPGYANAAGGNFAVGTAVKAEGYPDAARTIGANAGATTTYVDIGAAQRAEAGGSGGGPVFGGMVVR